ncbi:ABC transporter substrate-binding protein [Roseovarius amoyensis]|uniref:ABC transporter substrate-binding protein n=1 Tax=Roseovarius amoyensis TaxID=2211448 RepID=UPI001EF7A6D1|nr:ABC transporter substrate-binding protein [Roseovarius amoyensis]
MKPKFISMALAAAAGIGLATPAVADTKVGLLLPYSGTYAALGNDITDGFNLALELSGRTGEFEIVREDTEVKPPVGLAKARKLVLEDEVDVIVGIVSSGVLGAVRDFVDGAQVPLIVANAGNDNATGDACSAYITRVSFSNAQVNRPMGTWMAEQGIKKVYTLAPDYAAGRQMIEAFTETYTAAGGEIVGGEYTPFGQTSDFGPYLANAKASGAEAIFVFYAGGEAISFVKQYGSFGKELPLYGSGFLTSSLYVNAQGEAAVGVTTSLHYVPTLDTPENNAFVEAFGAAYEGRTPSEYAVHGYDAAMTLMAAVDSGASDRETIAATLPQVKYVGPRGPLEIDPATNNVVQNVYIYETVMDGGALTQKVVGTVEAVRDDPKGCALQ